MLQLVGEFAKTEVKLELYLASREVTPPTPDGELTHVEQLNSIPFGLFSIRTL